MQVVIKRRHGFLQLSADGVNPLPVEVRGPIERMLTYTYVEHLRGRPRYNGTTGEQERIRFEPRALFTYDASRLLLCQQGYLPRLQHMLQQQGHAVIYEDLNDPWPARAYEEDWEGVVRAFKFRPQQDVCLQQIAMHDCGVIDAVTAFGKMWVIAMVCRLYSHARIDIIVKPASVARKMRKLLTEFVANVGLVGDGSSHRSRVTIYMADSLHRSDGEAQIVLADECITGDAEIAVPGGTKKLVDVSIGSQVMCYGGEKVVSRRVTNRWAKGPRKVLHLRTEQGRQLRCTANHLIYTAQGWKDAGSLQPGDQILSLAGAAADRTYPNVCGTSFDRLIVVEELGVEEVFDIEVEDCHNFFANGLLVHNCHQLMTDNYVEKLSRYTRARMFGFTASKETRGDNLHARMEGIFGPTIFYIDYPTAQSLGLVAPIRVQWFDVNMDYNPVENVRDDVQRKRFGIWQNEHRNRVIGGAVRPLVQNDQQILIAVETVEHACYLKKYLPDFELCYNEGSMDTEQMAYYRGLGLLAESEPLMTPERRVWMADAFERRQLMRVIATTIWSVGVSFDSLQVQVRAEGSRSETKSIQVPGRVCRTAEGKDFGIVQDFMDNFDTGFRNASLERRRVYSGQHWSHYDANWNPIYAVETTRGGRRRHRALG